jgi:3-oxoacyl-[acyl-carrier-protein] synthase-3
MYTRIYSHIVGTGCAFPQKILTNADLQKEPYALETSDEWIVQRTGIRQRHIISGTESTAQLAHEASIDALKRAGVAPQELDLILVATSTPDQVFPSTACLLQAHLGGGESTAAFDLNAACSGFLYGLSMADAYIQAHQARTVLLVGAECMSRIINWKDRSTAVLFGDGAGAVVLKASFTPGIYGVQIHSDGQYKDLLYTPHQYPQQTGDGFLRMSGSEVFKVGVKKLEETAQNILAEHGFEKKDIQWLIPHQANLRMIEALAKRLELPLERVVLTLDRCANTSAASIPLALHQAVMDDRLSRGDLLLFEAFGGGFTWGSALVRY